MKQKFKMLTFVRVYRALEWDDMGLDTIDFEGIVASSKGQEHCNDVLNEYTVFQMEDGKIINRNSWYFEEELTALDHQDRDEAEELIEQYILGK